jgi:hypothetical protein
MTARSEIENRLLAWANSKSPPIPIASENSKFKKPTDGSWLEFVMLNGVPTNRNVAAAGYRLRGQFQINIYGPAGIGAGGIEELANEIVNIFPVIPKIGTVSIEQPLSPAPLITTIGTSVCMPITGKYRIEY